VIFVRWSQNFCRFAMFASSLCTHVILLLTDVIIVLQFAYKFNADTSIEVTTILYLNAPAILAISR
jgi:hypothetical protein